MRMIKTLLLLFFAGFLLRGTAQNVTLVVTTNDGEELAYQLTEESQLYFNNGESLVIDDGTGATATFQLADIRKIVCSEVADIQENTASRVQIFPNPARDCFVTHNLTGSKPARVYTLDGRLVKMFQASEGLLVDVSDLASGIYLLHIDGQTLKLMKL